MEPTKFEQRIKEKLDLREIQPEAASWDALKTRLHKGKEPVKSTNRRPLYIWLSAAAMLLLMLSIGISFSPDDNLDQPIEEIVVGTEPKEESIKKSGQSLIQEPSTPIEVAVRAQEKNPETTKPANIQKTFIKEFMAVQSPIVPNDSLLAQDSLTPVESDLIQTKLKDVLIKVQELEKNATALSEAEVDALLRKAQKEIIDQKYNRLTQSIDAMALLDEVEYEIDLTIKDKLFEALKKGFMEVRTAVAEGKQY